MLIVCPSCASSYVLDDARIGPAGRRVRCASCRETFFVAPPGEDAASFPSDPDPNLTAAGEPAAFTDADGASADSLWNDALAEHGSEPDPAERTDQAEEPAPLPDEIEAEWKDAHDPVTGSDPGRELDIPAETIAPPGKAVAPDKKAARAAGRSKNTGRLRWQPPVAAMLALGILVAGGGLVFGRSQIVRVLPETAALYAAAGLPVNLRGLAFHDVRSELVREGEARLLVVEGEIANINSMPLQVPAIGIGVMGEGSVALYRWTADPEQATLAPGERTRFKARLVSPPQEGRQVLVRFIDAGDAGSIPARTGATDARLSGTDARVKQ